MTSIIQRSLLLVALFLSVNLLAQEGEGSFFRPDEKLLIESKWHYSHTLHAASNTIVHKAEDQYDYYIYFRYDYSYQEFLNDRLNKGKWKLKGSKLKYNFRDVKEFEVIELSEEKLILEFNLSKGKGKNQYHFDRVESEDAPFPKPSNELPEILVEADDPSGAKKRRKRGWLSKLFQRNKINEIYAEEKLTHIGIELIGGGYYGGINPVVKDFIMIKSDGRLIKELETVQNGAMVVKKNISREELERFADYIVAQGFFEMERRYDCTSPICYKRKKESPKPVPLRLNVAYGDQNRLVTIAIWGKDEMDVQYVDYPPALDYIIEAIQKMANRQGDQVVKK